MAEQKAKRDNKGLNSLVDYAKVASQVVDSLAEQGYGWSQISGICDYAIKEASLRRQLGTLPAQ